MNSQPTNRSPPTTHPRPQLLATLGADAETDCAGELTGALRVGFIIIFIIRSFLAPTDSYSLTSPACSTDASARPFRLRP
jgi:hypothetical protein